MSNEQTEALAKVEQRKEYLRSEIDRCNAAIEGGDSDPWWREDLGRLKHELQCLEEPTKRATPSPAPSDTLERREAIAVGLSDKIILRLDIGEDDPRLSKIIDELRADLAALSLPAREVTWPPAFQEEYRNRDLDTPERYSVLLAREVSGERVASFAAGYAQGQFDTLATTPAPREKLEADLVEAKKALVMLRDFGCPVCSGDCGSANPPVMNCPMQAVSATLAKLGRSAEVG
jgi:hypothetical protein